MTNLNRKISSAIGIMTRRLIGAEIDEHLARSIIVLHKRLPYVHDVAVIGDTRADAAAFAFDDSCE